MAFARYLGKRALWYLAVLFVALLLNFLLPRLVPGNPVDAIVASMTRGGGATGEQRARPTRPTWPSSAWTSRCGSSSSSMWATCSRAIWGPPSGSTRRR